jgi:hypothetical protein
MKIVDIGKCIDNIDPKGMGRIRVKRYNDMGGQIENAIDYEPWSERDLFVASPFLPTNINFVPEIDQSVKIITYNTEKSTVNVEYIAGPFTTMYDYHSQTFSQQVTNTTYGNSVKMKPAIRNTSGEYINQKSENVFANETDFAIYGKSGSDVLFTENGLQLRGGKLLSKDAASELNRQTMVDFPLLARKSARMYLKKFPKKMILESKVVKKTVVENKDLSHIIEYDVSNPSPDENNPATISFYIYKVTNPFGDTFKTNFFTQFSDAPSTLVKLLNTNNSSSTPTFQITGVTSVGDVYREIRDKIYNMHEKGLSGFDFLYEIPNLTDDIHPFFFRPTKVFKNRTYVNSGDTFNKNVIFRNINVRRIGPASGLIWSKEKARNESKDVESVEELLRIDPNSPEQTFGAITADKVYLLSTDLGENETSSPVPFLDLDGYDYKQEDYINLIEPNTFSTVRGENLVAILEAIVKVLYSHVHNPLMPISGQSDYQDGNALLNLVKTLENDILNKSIRIN